MSSFPQSQTDLIVENSDGIIHVTLNRPQALNALTPAMFSGLADVLACADGRPILVSGAGGKAFCAGGDIKAQVLSVRTGDLDAPRRYFRDEYAFNARLFGYDGPYISYLNGIVMGGGFGVSAHGSHLVTCEVTQFAMPEVKIGFFTDVGIVYHLARLPHHIGTYLALTGNTIGARDMLFSGLAHTHIPLRHFDSMKAALRACSAAGVIADVLDGFHQEPVEDGFLERNLDVIARCFAYDRAEAIVEALLSDGSGFALEAAADIAARCPLSVKVTLAHLRRATHETFDAVIARDLVLAYRFLETPDFTEGVRAAIIDKDRNPRWSARSIHEIPDSLVALYLGGQAD